MLTFRELSILEMFYSRERNRKSNKITIKYLLDMKNGAWSFAGTMGLTWLSYKLYTIIPFYR